MNSTVPAPTYPHDLGGRHGRGSHRRPGSGRRAGWKEPPRRSSGGVAAGCTPARPGLYTCPWVSAKIWISMWRGSGHVPLHQQGAVAEGADGLPAGAGNSAGQVGGVVDAPHALAAAARGRLEQHRQPDVDCGRGQLVVGQAGLASTRYDRDAGCGHHALGVDLVAHELDGLGRRPDEHHPGGGRSGGPVRGSPTGSRSPGGGRPPRSTLPRPRSGRRPGRRRPGRWRPPDRRPRRGGRRGRGRCRRRRYGCPWPAGCA